VVNGQTDMSVDLANEIKKANVLGVKSVHPIVSGRVTVPELDNRSLLLLGVERSDTNVENGDDDKWGMKVAWQATRAEIGAMFLFGPHPILVGDELADVLEKREDAKNKDAFQVEVAEKKTAVRQVGRITIKPDSPAAAL